MKVQDGGFGLKNLMMTNAFDNVLKVFPLTSGASLSFHSEMLSGLCVLAQPRLLQAGYEKINHDFHVLEPILTSERSDWSATLSSTKGVYLISDTSAGKHYIGSAYGDMGIWSMWASYMGTGHRWNDELTKLISERSLKYARESFLSQNQPHSCCLGSGMAGIACYRRRPR